MVLDDGFELAALEVEQDGSPRRLECLLFPSDLAEEFGHVDEGVRAVRGELHREFQKLDRVLEVLVPGGAFAPFPALLQGQGTKGAGFQELEKGLTTVEAGAGEQVEEAVDGGSAVDQFHGRALLRRLDARDLVRGTIEDEDLVEGPDLPLDDFPLVREAKAFHQHRRRVDGNVEVLLKGVEDLLGEVVDEKLEGGVVEQEEIVDLFADLGLQGLLQVRRRDSVGPGQDFAELLLGFLLVLERFLEVGSVEESLPHEDFADAKRRMRLAREQAYLALGKVEVLLFPVLLLDLQSPRVIVHGEGLKDLAKAEAGEIAFDHFIRFGLRRSRAPGAIP